MKVDTEQSKVAILASLGDDIQPPPNMVLTAKELRHYQTITDELARAELTPMLLEICALLARVLCRLETNQAKLTKETEVIVDPKGFVHVNPRVAIIRSLTADMVKLRTHLLSSGGTVSVQGSQAKRRLAKQIEGDAEETMEDDELGLIPRRPSKPKPGHKPDKRGGVSQMPKRLNGTTHG